MNGLGRRFLSYIVEKALAGRADRIKAFPIGTDVLGRGLVGAGLIASWS